jgi:hypothetical protein
MAIQLNERDHLIFKYVEEHQVLLEKHIAWFISVESKPVLIRDRLRKLFYLDYLLCQRHKNTLPWWTTPTKPLVYTLASMTRGLISAEETDLDLSDSEVQRHLLEIANLRMLFMMDASERLISELDWKTCRAHRGGLQHVDAKVSFQRNGVLHRVGIVNHPVINDGNSFMNRLHASLADDEIEMIWIVSRDEDHQLSLQNSIARLSAGQSDLQQSLAFATHQELYKSGMVKTRWQTVDQHIASIFVESLQEYEAKSCAHGRAIASA